MQKKIVLSLLLTTMLLASALLSFPVTALDYDSAQTGERQIVAYGMLHDELFPEFNYTGWQKRSINVGFSAFGEMVTDQDPFNQESTYGVGLSYPTDSAWQIDMKTKKTGADYGIYPSEHIATPAQSGAELRYYPVEGWQLYWKFSEETPSHTVDPWWHVSMAIYGNHSSPYGRARVDVVPVSATIITNTSRLLVYQIVVRTHNETIKTKYGFEPELFQITGTLVFFKNTKKVATYWDVEYLKTEYGPVNVVFRRMTDLDIDQKFQDYEDEAFAVFYANSRRGSWTDHLMMDTQWPDALAGCGDDNNDHMFWTGCEYWPQNYSLAVVWTNQSIDHWVPPAGYSASPQHHVATIAYYPNCSNWDTDNWNHYTYNLMRGHTPATPGYLFFGEGLGRRYGFQPDSVEYRGIDSEHWVGADLFLGQWNVTLSSATAYKRAKFLTLYTITNCSDTFGYVGSPSSYDWDSEEDLSGEITASEIKYLNSEYFNATYKLSTETRNSPDSEYLDVGDWFPFSGVHYREYMKGGWLSYYDGNEWLVRHVTEDDPRNTTVIIGDSTVHYDTVTKEGAATIDVVGAVMVGEAFGSYVGDYMSHVSCPTDPKWLAIYDTEVFSKLSTATMTYTQEKTSQVYIDPVSVKLKLTGWKRPQGRGYMQDNYVDEIFETPTCTTWDVKHTINIGGPKVNLGTAYFNDHTFIIWISADTGTELAAALTAGGGFFSIPTGTFYPATGGYSLISITEDLNLTSWNTLKDGQMYGEEDDLEHVIETSKYEDGPTIVDPYAGMLVYGMSGVDTHAACYWLAHYWCQFHDLYTNATAQPITGEGKRGVTSVLLNTEKMCGVEDEDWEWAVQEMVGPVQGRWRFETGDNWGPWISYPCTIDWYSEYSLPEAPNCLTPK